MARFEGWRAVAMEAMGSAGGSRVVPFPGPGGARTRRRAVDGRTGAVLVFTGVRYDRPTPDADEPRPAERGPAGRR